MDEIEEVMVLENGIILSSVLSLCSAPEIIIPHITAMGKKWLSVDYEHNALIGEVKSKYPIKSHITWEFSAKYPKKTVICFQKIPLLRS